MTGEPWSVDLHSHTVYSDGSRSPAELVQLAKSNGVRVLSITDHDHTGGIDEALAVGVKKRVEIIPGIELSVAHAEFEDIHILAYYFAWHAPELQAKLEAFRVARDTRADRILDLINAKLRAEGRAPLEYDAVKARVRGAFGRPHIANALIERGYVSTMNAAFQEYLIPCNVSKHFFSAEEALGLIRDIRGISVVAHPKLITPDRVRLHALLDQLRGLGLDGIEAYHSDHGPEDRFSFARLAEQWAMVVTGGSDYHGFNPQRVNHNGGGKLGGLQLPYSVVVGLRQGYLARHPIAFLLLGWPAGAVASMRRALLAQYKPALAKALHTLPTVSGQAPLRASERSSVLDLHSSEAARIDEIVAAAEALGVQVVGVPWDASGLAGHPALAQTAAISPQRFQRTPLERLAHELVHEVILAQ